MSVLNVANHTSPEFMSVNRVSEERLNELQKKSLSAPRLVIAKQVEARKNLAHLEQQL